MQSALWAIDNPKTFVEMSLSHKIEGMGWSNCFLQQFHKLNIESNKLLIILHFLLQTDCWAKLLNGSHCCWQLFQGQKDLSIIETFRKFIVHWPIFFACLTEAFKPVFWQQLDFPLLQGQLCIVAVVTVIYL